MQHSYQTACREVSRARVDRPLRTARVAPPQQAARRSLARSTGRHSLGGAEFALLSPVMDTRTAPVHDSLRIDAAAATNAIVAMLRHDVSHSLRRSGLVVAISGGID